MGSTSPLSNLTDHQVDHLLLLVGKNPLPNAVAGKLLTRPGGRISLIHTADTADIATRLQQWLLDSGFKPELLSKPVKPANPSSIIIGVREQLEKYRELTVGLNYTGGTKAMSVHAFRALEWWAKDKSCKPVFSYLDAPSLNMLFDPGDPEGMSNIRAVYVALEIELRLDELCALHGWTLQKFPRKKPLLAESAQALTKTFHDHRAAWDWVDWKDKLLDKQGMLKDIWRQKANCIPLPTSTRLQTVCNALINELGQTGALDLDRAVNEKKVFSIDLFCEWLDGKWLEHCVLGILNNMPQSLRLHSCAQNVVPAEVVFDLDVIAIRGYQLFAFSCSTDSDKDKGNRRRLKMKLFEAYIRAHQLGGDEACVALVCCGDDPEFLEEEMRRDYDLEGRIRVFGRKHFSDLSEHIREWIESQSGVKN